MQWFDDMLCRWCDWNERTIHWQIMAALVIAVATLWLTS